jgi:hypothetical protein
VRRTSSCPGATATRCQTAVAARAWLPNASAWHARAGRALPRRARNARYRLVESHVSASTSHPVFPAGGCMTCVGRSRQGCSASACASKPRGGAESSKWKPSWRSRDLSKARLGRGETRRTRRMVCAPSRRGGRQGSCIKALAVQPSGLRDVAKAVRCLGGRCSAISALPAPVRGRGPSYRAIGSYRPGRSLDWL